MASINSINNIIPAANFTVSAGLISLPTTSSTVGQVTINSVPVLHSFNGSGAGGNSFGGGAGNLTLSTSNTVTAFGVGALASLTTGSNNVAFGMNAANLVATQGSTAAFGDNSLRVGTGGQNTSIGGSTLYNLTTGIDNTCLGYLTGLNYTGGESSNIIIGGNTRGTLGESHVLRIGTATGTGDYEINATYIQGIFGKTVSVVTGIPVVIDSTGLMGTVVSSKRFKSNIVDMKDNPLMSLRPVNFTYKEDETNREQYGLIAEEVAQIFPNLVVHDEDGLPFTVKYQELPVLLLNQIQKQNKVIMDLMERIKRLEEK